RSANAKWNEDGYEEWAVATRRTRTARESSKTAVSVPQIETSVSKSQEKSASGSLRFASDFPVWRKKPYDYRTIEAVQPGINFTNPNAGSPLAFLALWNMLHERHWSNILLGPGIMETSEGTITNPLPADRPVRLREIKRAKMQG